jgi:iron(III) transport system permease protein
VTTFVEHVRMRRRESSGRRLPQFVFIVITLAMTIFVILPIGAMLVQTVYQGHTGFSGFATYREVFGQPETVRALLDTLYLAAGSMVLALAMGTGLAWIISSTNVPLAKYMNIAPLLPMLLPPLIGAVGWEFLLSPRPGLLNIALRAILPGNSGTGPLNIYSLWGMIWVNSLYVTPYVFVIVNNALRNHDSSLDEAARVAGSPTRTILRQITIPMLRPALLGGAILALVTSIGDFSVPLILGEPTQIPVLTTLIYNELSNYPQNVQAAAALGTVLIAVTLVALYFQGRWLRGSSRFVTVGGRGARHRTTTLSAGSRWSLFALLVIYVLLVVVAPILAILNVALRPYWTTDVSLKGLTWHNFGLVFQDPVAMLSVENSLKLAFVGASVGIVIAVLIAYTVQRSKVRGRRVLDYAATIPLAIPGTVFGASLLIFFLDGPVVLYGTNLLLIIAYVAYFLPQGFRTSSAALAQTSPELEEAAVVCGSGWLRSLGKITMPIIRPSVASAWVFLFILMSREVAMSALLASAQTSVISFAMISMWSSGSLSELAAYSVVILLISAGLTIIAQFVGNWRRI